MIYADTTFLVACNVRSEPLYEISRDFYAAHQDVVWLWSPWHRVEVFNSIRQLSRDSERKYRILPDEARAIIRNIEQDVRCDYLQHMEADWRDVLRAANDISISHSFDLPCRAADLLHVAYAVELSAETFVGFDTDQLNLAAAAGLKAVRPSG
jgi:predicted nucleic acid-binding protein